MEQGRELEIEGVVGRKGGSQHQRTWHGRKRPLASVEEWIGSVSYLALGVPEAAWLESSARDSELVSSSVWDSR